RVMSRLLERRTACPAVYGRIVDLQFGLAIESAHDVDSTFHCRYCHLRTLRGHGCTAHPSSGALTQGGCAQPKAEEHNHECRASCHKSISCHIFTYPSS